MRVLFSATAIFLMTLSAHADTAAGLKALDEGNVSEAAKQFQMAWEGGNADAAFYLGRIYELGIGTEVDLNRAAQLFKVGADAGSARAKNRYGLMLLQGRPTLKDFKGGTQLICAAAEAGDANAQFNCGVSFADGIGVTKDAAVARDWWQKAADQGHVAAINFLARDLSEGDGADPAKALSLFEQTARLGNPMGLYEAARLYADGTGAEADPVRAYAYANLAAARLHPEAAALRDRIESGLTPDQVVAAQEMSLNWKPTAPTDAGKTSAQESTASSQ